MRIREKEVYLINEYQNNPDFSMRELAAKVGMTKDTIFRALNKFKKYYKLENNYWVNFPKLGLKPYFLLIQTTFEKANKAIRSILNPYILKISISLGGEGLFILAKYALPPRISLRSLLGLAKSWNWHLKQYQNNIIFEGSNFSFDYFNLLNQNWEINWLNWGLIIKEMLIRREITEIFPKSTMNFYDEKIKNEITLDEIKIIDLLVNNIDAPIHQLANKYNIPSIKLYEKKKELTKHRILKKIANLNPKMIYLTEKIIVIIQTDKENVIASLIKGFQLLPISTFYRVENDFQGLIIFLSLPKGGVSKIFHILSEYLSDNVDNYWLLPILKEEEFQRIPNSNLFTIEKKWLTFPLIKEKKIIMNGNYLKDIKFPQFKIDLFD